MGPSANGFDFERDWPELRARVQKSLARWRVPAWLEEDIVQETGVRIWNLRAQIDPTRSVEGLAGRIAVNLLKDHLRRERFLTHDTDLSSKAVSQDVENEVIARDEWHRVRSALAKLNPARRAALIAAMVAEGGDRTPAAMRMMKMRARKQLRVLMEEVTKAKAGCVVMMQQSWDAAVRALGLRSPHAQHLAQVASAAVIAITAGALALPSLDSPSIGSAGKPRVTIETPDAALANFDRSDPSAWEDEIKHLAELDRDTPKEANDRARKLFRVGPLSYGPGDSTGSGTVNFDPNKITNGDPGLGVSPNKLLCRVTVLRSCKEGKKH